ncbi:MAG: ornithine carbamoyltransferase [Candidatus Thermoplasmatota archaeon]|nr:ornithine carbamoyltransferase [Candidatus Thermoplasmatota archaeon]
MSVAHRSAMKRDLISITDAAGKVNSLIRNALKLKNEQKNSGGRIREKPLKDRQLAMIFEKPSTRTRVSFEVAMSQLGGNALFLNSRDLQLGRGETISDTAKVLSRYVDGMVYRAFENRVMKELATCATVPVINGLDDLEHPCQALADLMTIQEKFGRLKGLKLAYVGDGNNVCNSLMLASAMTGIHFIAATPPGYAPPQAMSQLAASIALEHKSRVEIVTEPDAAAKNADILYTDVWTSMGQESEKREREKIFGKFQINSRLLSQARKNAIVMHCLPAHRGLEITDDVIDGINSVVFDQAENRLHVQKAVLLWLIQH